MLGCVCILDLLSKALKYEFHYDYIEKKIWQYFFYTNCDYCDQKRHLNALAKKLVFFFFAFDFFLYPISVCAYLAI